MEPLQDLNFSPSPPDSEIPSPAYAVVGPSGSHSYGVASPKPCEDGRPIHDEPGTACRFRAADHPVLHSVGTSAPREIS